MFAERGYQSPASALSDLVGWEQPEARRRVVAAERVSRTVPDGLRRAVAARDRGCANPGCGRPVSWCEIHQLTPWEQGGETKLSNLAMLCRMHHRQIHATEWICRIRDGLPEFIPPPWVDSEQRPRRRALPHLTSAA